MPVSREHSSTPHVARFLKNRRADAQSLAALNRFQFEPTSPENLAQRIKTIEEKRKRGLSEKFGRKA